MFRGYWLTAIALGLTLATSAYADPVGYDPARQTNAHKKQAEQKHNSKPAPIVTIQNNVERIARALETSIPKPQTAKEKQDAADDLRAQKDMAKWANWMFWIGLAEVLATGLGIFLIYRTLKATWAAVNVAKDTAQRQLRAYVGITSGGAGIEQGKFKATLTLSNRGQTPAFNVHGAGIARFGAAYDAAWEDEFKSFGISTYLPPSGEIQLVVTEKIDVLNEAAASIDGGGTIFISGRMDYRDAFGVDRWITFRFTVAARDAGGRYRVGDCEDGNDAN